jgi:hypothetical protein
MMDRLAIAAQITAGIAARDGGGACSNWNNVAKEAFKMADALLQHHRRTDIRYVIRPNFRKPDLFSVYVYDADEVEDPYCALSYVSLVEAREFVQSKVAKVRQEAYDAEGKLIESNLKGVPK